MDKFDIVGLITITAQECRAKGKLTQHGGGELYGYYEGINDFKNILIEKLKKEKC